MGKISFEQADLERLIQTWLADSTSLKEGKLTLHKGDVRVALADAELKGSVSVKDVTFAVSARFHGGGLEADFS